MTLPKIKKDKGKRSGYATVMASSQKPTQMIPEKRLSTVEPSKNKPKVNLQQLDVET